MNAIKPFLSEPSTRGPGQGELIPLPVLPGLQQRGCSCGPGSSVSLGQSLLWGASVRLPRWILNSTSTEITKTLPLWPLGVTAQNKNPQVGNKGLAPHRHLGAQLLKLDGS